MGEYSEGKATRNRALAVYKSGALRSVNSDIIRGIKKGGELKEKFDFELDKMTKKDKKNVLELIKRVRKQGDEISRQQAFQDSFKKELDKLKESNASLTSKCEELKGGYACDTNSLSCAASLKEENQEKKNYLRMQVRLDLKSMVPRQRRQKSLLTLLSAPDLYTASARFRVAFPSEYSPKVYQSTEPKRQETIY